MKAITIATGFTRTMAGATIAPIGWPGITTPANITEIPAGVMTAATTTTGAAGNGPTR